jgi:hypothetical protein
MEVAVRALCMIPVTNDTYDIDLVSNNVTFAGVV